MWRFGAAIPKVDVYPAATPTTVGNFSRKDIDVTTLDCAMGGVADAADTTQYSGYDAECRALNPANTPGLAVQQVG